MLMIFSHMVTGRLGPESAFLATLDKHINLLLEELLFADHK